MSLGVLIEFDNGETHSYKQAAWHKLTVLPLEKLEGKGGDSLSGAESSHVTQAGLTAGARVEHPKHGFGMVQSFQGATMGHPLYADGTPLKVKIAFDDGQTHEYKMASWHKLRLVQSDANQPPEPPALAGVTEEGAAPGFVVGARVEHAKHGLGTVQHWSSNGLALVKIAFDNGETHEYKDGALDKLREIEAAERDSSVVVALADRPVLLEAKAHWKGAESAFYKLAKVQLLAAPGHDGALDADAGAPPWSTIVVNDKAVSYEEVTAVRVDERALEFIVDHTRKYSSRAERLHLRMDTRAEFHRWRDALHPETIKPGAEIIKPYSTLFKSPSSLLRSSSSDFLKSARSESRLATPGKTAVAEERVLLEGRMSVRISSSPFHVPTVLKLTAASVPFGEKEPWSTFSYTSNNETVAVPCRAISAVRMHAGDANQSFEIEYAAPRQSSPKKSLGRDFVRMRVWTTSQEQFEEWRTALAPLPFTDGSAMDRARAWLDHHTSELPGPEDPTPEDLEQKSSKKTSDGRV